MSGIRPHVRKYNRHHDFVVKFNTQSTACSITTSVASIEKTIISPVRIMIFNLMIGGGGVDQTQKCSVCQIYLT
jgi:hypothetical protein